MNRQDKLLKLIIEEHINTAEPVGSNFLVQKADLDISGATVRNEMRELENIGYLTHPHTSAGRIPTESGYKHYITNLMELIKPSKEFEQTALEIKKHNNDEKEALKQAAKYFAQEGENAVIVMFGQNSIYYTGLSNLFSKPELRDYANSISMSALFDECEQRIPSLLDAMEDNLQIFIGTENPLGTFCSTIAGKIGNQNLFAFVGPLRMNYAKNVGIMQCVQNIF
jgi:heat-inducible transcriptional repressor